MSQDYLFMDSLIRFCLKERFMKELWDQSNLFVAYLSKISMKMTSSAYREKHTHINSFLSYLVGCQDGI